MTLTCCVEAATLFHAVVLFAEECRLMFVVSAAWYTGQCEPRPISQLWGFSFGVWVLDVFGFSNPKFGGMKLLLSLV